MFNFCTPLGFSVPWECHWESNSLALQSEGKTIIGISKKLLLWKRSTQSNSKGDFKFILVHNKNSAQQNLVSATAAQTLNFQPPAVPISLRAQAGPSWGITGTASVSAELCWVPDKVTVTTTGLLLGEPKSPAWPQGKQSFREMKSRSLWRNVPFSKGSSLQAAREQEETWPKAVMFSYSLAKCFTSGQLPQFIFKM